MPFPYGASATGGILTYTATATPGFLNDTFGAVQLNNGDVGPTSTGTTTYAIVNAATGSLTLTLAATTTIGSIAIYEGYTNRDDGTYTLSDAAGTTLGAYTIATPVGNTNNGGTDDFYLTFNTPVTTSALNLAFTSTDSSPSASFREIQVFGVPEPHSVVILLCGLGLLVVGQRLRLRQA